MQQTDGVSSRGGIKDDVVVTGGDCGIGQQRGEFIESRDFRRAGSGKLFLNALDDGFGKFAPHGADDAVAIGLRGGLRVDFQREKPRHGGNGRDLVVANVDPEHLTDIRRRIGADEQHAASGFGELNRRRAGDRCFADAALAGEEEETRSFFEKFHFDLSAAGTAAAASALFRFALFRDASPTRQLGAVRITTGERDVAIDKDHG